MRLSRTHGRHGALRDDRPAFGAIDDSGADPSASPAGPRRMLGRRLARWTSRRRRVTSAGRSACSLAVIGRFSGRAITVARSACGSWATPRAFASVGRSAARSHRSARRNRRPTRGSRTAARAARASPRGFARCRSAVVGVSAFTRLTVASASRARLFLLGDGRSTARFPA